MRTKFTKWFNRNREILETLRTLGSVLGGFGGILATLRIFHLI